jgi:hypothetical protein
MVPAPIQAEAMGMQSGVNYSFLHLVKFPSTSSALGFVPGSRAQDVQATVPVLRISWRSY